MKDQPVIPPDMKWLVHLPNLLVEICKNPQCEILRIPLTIVQRLLLELGERCAELNDPILNELMVRLTIYAVADPHEKALYNRAKVDEVLTLAYEYKRKRKKENARDPANDLR